MGRAQCGTRTGRRRWQTVNRNRWTDSLSHSRDDAADVTDPTRNNRCCWSMSSSRSDLGQTRGFPPRDDSHREMIPIGRSGKPVSSSSLCPREPAHRSEMQLARGTSLPHSQRDSLRPRDGYAPPTTLCTAAIPARPAMTKQTIAPVRTHLSNTSRSTAGRDNGRTVSQNCVLGASVSLPSKSRSAIRSGGNRKRGQTPMARTRRASVPRQAGV